MDGGSGALPSHELAAVTRVTPMDRWLILDGIMMVGSFFVCLIE